MDGREGLASAQDERGLFVDGERSNRTDLVEDAEGVPGGGWRHRGEGGCEVGVGLTLAGEREVGEPPAERVGEGGPEEEPTHERPEEEFEIPGGEGEGIDQHEPLETARLLLHRRKSGDGSAAVSKQVHGRLGEQF